MRDDRWTDITPSEFPREQRALDYLKRHLPNEEPYRAWGPFAFRARSGEGWPEVDAVVVGPRAIFLIEIKSWTGTLEGDDRGWTLSWPGGANSKRTNPFPLTDAKAKKLKGRLEKTGALRGVKPLPRIEPLIFFSEEDFDCQLPDSQRHRLVGLDHDLLTDCSQEGDLPGVITQIREWSSGVEIYPGLSDLIDDAMREIGIKPSEQYTKVGPYLLNLERTVFEDGEVAIYEAAHEVRPQARDFRVVIHKPMDNHPQGRGKSLALNAARREFDLLWPRATHHPGLARPEHLEEDHPLGPAVVFRVPAGSLPVEPFLEQRGPDLSEAGRVELLRKLAEAVRFAHSRNMYHRSLRPGVVEVHRDFNDDYQPVISRWDTGLRASVEGSKLTAVSGTVHLGTGDADADRYLAPEIADAVDPDPELADVFGLGALGYLILSGQAPPVDRDAALTAAGGYLDVETTGVPVSGAVREVLATATRGDAAQRIGTVDEFVEALESATVTDETDREPSATNREETSQARPETGAMAPGALRRGDRFGRYEILARLPRGATGYVFRVRRSDDQREGVLKVASDGDEGALITAEALALDRLHSPAVVDLLEGPVDLFGHQAIFTRYADQGTLRMALDGSSRLSLREVRHFATDLFRAAAEMEHRGIFHRDIKPENVGIWTSSDGSGEDTSRVMLFDFSLAEAPLTELRLGTVPYRDPFLGLGDRAEFDFGADRYSIAVVLHEMLTGRTPRWGDGSSSPAHSEEGLQLATGLFPEELPDLDAFFRRALSRDVGERFSGMEEMGNVWELALRPPDDCPESPSQDDPEVSPGVPLASPPELVVNTLGDRIRVAFSKRKSLVVPAEVEAVSQWLAGIPEDEIEFDPDRKRWLVDPGPSLVDALSKATASTDVQISTEAAEFLAAYGGPERGPGGESINIGPFAVQQAIPSEESFRGQPPSGADEQGGHRRLYELEGPEDLVLTVGEELFNNGEHQVKVVDARGSGARFERLVQGCRLTVARHGDLHRIDLRQTRMTDDVWSNMKKATREQLAEGLGEDVLELLYTFGAEKIGTRGDLLADQSSHKNYLCALFPVEASLIPLVAYVATRVAPVAHRFSD